MTNTLGKYTLIRKLATGGMAEVFLARAEGPGGFAKKCVVKRILPHFNDDPRFIEMFLGEARLAAELNHPNLVQIFDFGQAGGQYYLAMEYIDGANLRVLNQAARRMQGPLSFPMAARLISMAAEGLHYAHELKNEQGELVNLVHRDISPDNILVSKNGAVKVVDFGIAKASTQPHLTKSGMIKGKMAYMPPEQLAREPLDRRADLFALGIVFYELVTGGMPFDATSEVSIIQAIMSQKPLEKPTVYRPDCPPELEAIINKCLEKDRTKRYSSCVELQQDIETFIRNSGQSVGTREIANLVETVFQNEADTTMPNAVVSPSGLNDDLGTGLEKTMAGKSAEMPKPPPSAPPLGTGMSNTALRSVETNAVKRSKAPIFAGLGVLVIVGLVGGYFATRQQSIEVPKDPVKPVPVAVVDAGGAEEPKTIDAGVAVAVAEADAGTEELVDAGVAVAVEPPRPVAAKNGKLEFRIRPYATVYLDDRKLGDTPLPSMSVPVGKHKVRLVNAALSKDVELNVVIKPGENVVKHNLKE